jgi:hypothetical protein
MTATGEESADAARGGGTLGPAPSTPPCVFVGANVKDLPAATNSSAHARNIVIDHS